MNQPKQLSQPRNQQPKPAKQLQGKKGEQLAKKLLLSKGYQFLTQNFRTKLGEIDLIFQDKKTLVFVEVKTRSQLNQGMPEEAVTPHKLRVIERVATEFMQKHALEDKVARIDVVAVELLGSDPEIRHLIDVTS